MFTTLDTRAHDDIKAKTAIGYGDKNSALEPGVDAQITSFVGVVRNKYLNGAKLLDFGTLTSYFTMDVITKAGFGEAFGYLEKEEDLFDFLAGVRDNCQYILYPGAVARPHFLFEDFFKMRRLELRSR